MKIMDKLSTYAALLGVIGAIGAGRRAARAEKKRMD